jgi:16S rRNA G966 N2-methylase RsmD
MTRSQKQPILYQDKLKVPEKFLRFATPEVVADYRAEKLKCEKLVEIGAGIGGQTIAFSKFCKKVLAIEIDKSKANILIQNLKKLKINNVEVLIADGLSKIAIDKITKFNPEIIFCDTERPEKAERTLEAIKPSVKKILEIFSKITSKIAIEIPPYTKEIEQLNYPLEKEFISLNKQLNRLTLYFNELKESEISAISLPSKEKIISKSKKIKKINSAKNYKYLYVIDPTIIVANLLGEISNEFDSPILELNKPVMLSKEKKKSNFLDGYEIISICKNNQEEILNELKKINTKKVELRYKIEPKDYWKIRNFYENQLNGNKEVSLFIQEKSNEAILCEKLNLSSLIKLSH